MNIITEGVSRCGKSTVIAELANRLGFQIKKYENPKSKRETAELFAAYLMDLKENENAIYDRGHLSELVYGPLYRPRNYLGSDFLPRLLYGIDRILAKRGHTLVIYFWPLSQTIMNYEGREQYKPNFRTELTMYDGVMSRTKLPVIKMATQEVIPGHIPSWKSVGNIVDHLMIKLRSYYEF